MCGVSADSTVGVSNRTKSNEAHMYILGRGLTVITFILAHIREWIEKCQCLES
jgi:hypothetical protein